MKNLNKANESRKQKAINKLWNFSDHGIKSFKQLIDAGVFKSAKIEMVPQLKYNRAKYNRFGDHQAQAEYYRKCTEKTKKAYFLYYDEDINTEVSKYVFEYFNEVNKQKKNTNNNKKMITKDNLKEVLSSLDEEDVHKAMDADPDYVAVWANIFNAGWFSSIEAVYYTEETEEKVLGSGNLLTDKDEFLRLYKESGAYNKAIEEYI